MLHAVAKPSPAAVRLAMNLGASICATGDSTTIGANGTASSYYEQLILRSNGQLRSRGNFGIAGQRSDQILARLGTDVIPSGARYCLIFGGCINDISQSIAQATIKANLISIYATLRAAGVEPIVVSLPPTNTSANVPAYCQMSVWMKLYCRFNNIKYIDVWPLLATAAGAYTSGLNFDAIHPNSVGAVAIADAVSAALANPGYVSPLLAMTDTAADAGSLIANAISFAGGPPPTGFFVAGTGGTYAVNAADSGGFGSWYRATLSAGTGVGFNATGKTLASLGWVIGDKLAVGFAIRWVDSSQALSVGSNITSVTLSPSGAVLPSFQGGASGNTGIVYAEETITAGTTINQNWLATGTGYFEINRPIVVDVTAIGL